MSILSNGLVTVGSTGSTPAKLSVIDGGFALRDTSYTNTASRPAIVGGTSVGDYEIRAFGNTTTGDHGFMRLSAGGGTNATQKTWIDLSGYSQNSDMANTITFGTHGTEDMRIKDGKVGIGTTSPTGKLEISGANGSLYIHNNGDAIEATNNFYLNAKNPGKHLYLQTESSLMLDMFKSGSSFFTDVRSRFLRMRDNNAVFEMAGGTMNLYNDTDVTLIAPSISSAGVSQTGDITFRGRYYDSAQHDHNVDIKMIMEDNSPASRLGFVFGGSEKFSVKSSGKVGIGTTSPLEKLDVNGNIRISSGHDICIAGGNCLSTAGGGSSL